MTLAIRKISGFFPAFILEIEVGQETHLDFQ